MAMHAAHHTNATLADLPLVDCRVNLDISGKEVAKRFERDTSLPGVLVVQGSQLVGLVSRRHFHEQISSPYGLEIFFSRSIRAFLEVSEQKGRADFLIFPSSKSVELAVEECLQRPADSVYEPVVVSLGGSEANPQHLLLDFQSLLLAQSAHLTSMNQRLAQQSQQNRHYMLKLDEERQRVKQYVALLEKQQHLIRDRNRILESQQVELVKKNQEIAQLNERFVRISQLLSSEGRKTFEATFTGIDGICDNTRVILTVGRQLNQEMKTIQQASDMVARVSYQVRHLATKAAIVASHASSELSGFSQIAEEIGKLVSQTYQAAQQLELVAQRFENGVEDLTTAANTGTTTARSLTQDMGRMQDAIAQLEELIHPLAFPPDTASQRPQRPKATKAVPPPPPPRAAIPTESTVPIAATETEGSKDSTAANADNKDTRALLELLSQAETILTRIDQQFQVGEAPERVQQFRQKLAKTRETFSPAQSQ